MNEALASAYQFNPRLDAERATLRATDENVAQAMSGYRPVITGNGDINYQFQKSTVSVGRTGTGGDFSGAGGANGGGVAVPAGTIKDSTTLFPSGYSVNLTQNIFDGFQTTNAVREQEAGVRVEREVLRGIEQEVLLDAVTAYMDVVLNQAIVQLRENNVTVLSRELKATQDRFKVGEVTRTDVSQAEARRAAAVSALDLARANLKASRATYERVIGHPPSNLADQRPRERLLPKSIDDAIATGLHENPNVVAALYREQMARHTVDRLRGQLLPQAHVEASYGRRFDESESLESIEQGVVTGRLTVPIYEGGAVYSQVRQAKEVHVNLIQQVERFRTETQESVVASWSQLVAARAQLESDQAQVTANQTALEGVREEERVGQRTLLDVLNAEQELLNSQVQLATTRRNVVVASYLLLSSIGRLDMPNLSVAELVYDPEEHYFDTRRRWFGLDITHSDGLIEHLDVWNTQVSAPPPAK